MEATEFKQKLKEYIELEYVRLQESRKLEKHSESLNIWEKCYQDFESAEQILLEYIETLKYIKKRLFRKPEILYKEVKEWEFQDFYMKMEARYDVDWILPYKQHAQRYRDFMSPLKKAHSILKQIIIQQEK